MDSLRLSVVTRCPGNPGCKCRECWGLAEFMHATTGKDYGLPKREAPLRAVPLPLSAFEACTGGLTCDCPDCTAERLRAIERQKSSRPKQPWDVKAA